MASEERIADVRERIAELSEHHYRGFTEWKNDRLLIEWYREVDWDDGQEGTSLRHWRDLDDRALRHVMEGYVRWDGFEPAEKQAFIDGVIDEVYRDLQNEQGHTERIGQAENHLQGQMMPTEEQAENVLTQIGQLVSLRFTRTGETILPVFQGEPPDGAYFWSEVTPEDQIGLLETQVTWSGFSTDQELDVIQNIVGGKDAAHWMDGIRADRLVPVINQPDWFDEMMREAADDTAIEPPSFIPESLGEADAASLAGELDAIKRATYIESEEQVAGWNYEQGDGGVRFDELPVADREVMIETYVEWANYPGLTPEDQGRVMHDGARDDRSDFDRQLDALAERRTPANDNELER